MDAHDRELAILGVARALRSEYERQQHFDIGREAGVTEAEFAAIARDDLAVFEDEIRSMLRYVQAFVRGEIENEIHDTLAAHRDDRSVVGIGLLASHYVATARMLKGFLVPLEDEFIGWELEGLD